MEENFIEQDVRKRLLKEGIRELELHGPAAFSLRRVAQRSGLSCATPYRHFKSREHFISEITKYINTKWQLLYDEIRDIFPNDTERFICEVVSATAKFFTANPGYRAIMFAHMYDTSARQNAERAYIGNAIDTQIENYCIENNIPTAKEKSFSVRAAMYGTVFMLCSEETKDIKACITFLKERIWAILKS